ncbi:MAG TPA: ribonuclease HI family protein, partial [Spirochaetota bacterium]|nr:ribonuclease HI family protein [Spirochaetota bacterium]
MNLINQKIIYGAILKNVSLLEKLSKELNLDIKDLKKYLENSVDLTPTKNCVNESIIYIDGGSRGNPGESGIGIVIETDNKKKGYYFYTGIMTNNQAEYRGLLKALEISKTLNLKKIKIFSDSELLCNQINGRYK